MAKKKKKKIPWGFLKATGILLLSIVVGAWLSRGISEYLTESSYFEVKSIVVDTSLPFIQKADLRGIEGKNIFTIDLPKIQRSLVLRYPQVSELKIVKDFPNQITIKAVKRDPFAQIQLINKTIIVDDFGRVLAREESPVKHLPVFEGIPEKAADIQVGYKVDHLKVSLGLNILKAFRAQDTLREYTIHRMNLESTSKIDVRLENELIIYLERERLNKRMQILGVILNDPNVKQSDVKYIDLRFKEPIIGKKS